MNKWISVKDKKPDNDCLVYVCNSRWGCECFLAIYNKRADVWKQNAPNLYSQPCIDVTHYIELPGPVIE